MKKYPDLNNRDVYITGESYAGHYLPAIGAILVEKPFEGLKLQAVAIGNGWVDPWRQYTQYPEYAHDHKLVNETAYYEAKGAYQVCADAIGALPWPVGLDTCNIAQLRYDLIGDLNPYDIRIKCEVPGLCYDMSNIDNFLNRDDVQADLGVEGRAWQECDPTVYAFMQPDWATSMLHAVSEILASGVRVIVYSGDQDYICNWYGGLAWVNAVVFDGSGEFGKKEMTPWMMNGKEVGRAKKVNNFSFIRIYDAGHMVPMNQPEVAEFMLEAEVLQLPHTLQTFSS
eukprot:Platyproteum_vivax@DN7102_c0_g1_i4.p1